MYGNLLGNLAPAEFLARYWQKKPLLIRNALPGFESPLSPNELAGLACEPDVQSRMILEEGGEYAWELREGPFEAETFMELPESHWTLLVQEVDRLIPEVHDLLETVQFLPHWRIDDIMISYAPEHGNVGAHVDNYDVFLLQGYGQREWNISRTPVPPEEEEWIEDLDVRILSDFTADRTWELNPGDVLYLPPRIPHHGIALNDCMTYSIGCRAATHRKLLLGWMEYLAGTLDENTRYSDSDLSPRKNPGRITSEDIGRVRSIIDKMIDSSDELDRWFGEFVTQPSRGGTSMPPQTELSPNELARRIRGGDDLRRSEASRFSYIDQGPGRQLLFVDGSTYEVDAKWAELARLSSDHSTLPANDLEPLIDHRGCLDLLTALYNRGHVYFPT